jgi:hypothetical protein
MRDRAWRRYVEEHIVIRRLRAQCNFFWRWRGFEDVNKISHQHPKIKDYIGTENNFRYKTHTTTKWDTYHKVKYSPNKGKGYWRDGSKTREKDKKLFFKILKENGLK